MGESLFKYLTEAHPEALVELQIQYRMNEDIMTFSNELIYDHRLRCGSEAVSTVNIPFLFEFETKYETISHVLYYWIRSKCKDMY